MKKVKTLVFGGTCRGVGHLLQTQDSLLIERSASIGGEYFDAYKDTSDWGAELQTEEAREFRKEMESRQMIRGENTDFYGLAPLIYDKLKDYSSRIMLMTELAEINKTDAGFEIIVYNQSGKHEISCERIIDISVLFVTDLEFGKENIATKRLNAVIYNPGSQDGTVNSAELSRGRNDTEMILRMEVKPEEDFIAGREKLLAAWEKRSDELQDCRISSIAKEFDYIFKNNERQIAENWQYVNPVNYANPLLAIDAGFETKFKE